MENYKNKYLDMNGGSVVSSDGVRVDSNNKYIKSLMISLMSLHKKYGLSFSNIYLFSIIDSSGTLISNGYIYDDIVYCTPDKIISDNVYFNIFNIDSIKGYLTIELQKYSIFTHYNKRQDLEDKRINESIFESLMASMIYDIKPKIDPILNYILSYINTAASAKFLDDLFLLLLCDSSYYIIDSREIYKYGFTDEQSKIDTNAFNIFTLIKLKINLIMHILLMHINAKFTNFRQMKANNDPDGSYANSIKDLIMNYHKSTQILNRLLSSKLALKIFKGPS